MKIKKGKQNQTNAKSQLTKIKANAILLWENLDHVKGGDGIIIVEKDFGRHGG